MTDEAALAGLLDAVDELVALATDGTVTGNGPTALARHCRAALGADAVLIAVRRSGLAIVVVDADPDLEPTELRRQTALAQASLDDPVIDGHPGLPVADDDRPAPTAVVPRHLRRLVTELPGRRQITGTLTVCRHPAFEAEEVEVAMAYASLAGLALLQTGPTGESSPTAGAEGVDVVDRLFAVGIALQLVLQATDASALRLVVEEAIGQLDLATLDIRRAAFASNAAP